MMTKTLVEQLRAEISLNDIVDNLSDLADRIEREYLPRPQFEDGEFVQLGNGFTTKDGEVTTVASIEVNRDGWFLNGWAAECYGRHERVKRDIPEPLPESVTMSISSFSEIVDILVILSRLTKDSQAAVDVLNRLINVIVHERLLNLSSDEYDLLLDNAYE